MRAGGCFRRGGVAPPRPIGDLLTGAVLAGLPGAVTYLLPARRVQQDLLLPARVAWRLVMHWLRRTFAVCPGHRELPERR